MSHNQKQPDRDSDGFYTSINEKDDSDANLIKAAKEYQEAMQEVKRLGRQDKNKATLAAPGTYKHYVP